MTQLTTCRSIECYRKWLWAEIKRPNAEVLKALLSITEETMLGCWCSLDQTCHTDVIIRAARWLKEQQQ
jgi:hypothetical protein